MYSVRDKFIMLLRYAIQASEELPQIREEKWDNIYTEAERHSLVGVIFHGIQKGGYKPPRQLVFKWISDSERIRLQNVKSNESAIKVCRYFKQKGFRLCILKGQGNSLNYPDPYIRTSGDIDIWLEGGRKKIMEMVNKQWPRQLVRYHHVEIPAFDGIPVEVHFFPSYMHAPWRNRKLQKWFESQADKQFSNRVTLPGTDEQVSIPTVEFNVIYQLQHMLSHLLTEGFGLRQVVDYYYLLLNAKDKLKIENGELNSTLRYLGLEKFASAMMWVMKDVLSLEDRYMIAEPDEKEGRFLLSEIMKSGNMGHYDTRLGKTNGESVVHRYFRMTRRNFRFIKHYPEEAICEPIFRTWYYFWRMIHR